MYTKAQQLSKNKKPREREISFMLWQKENLCCMICGKYGVDVHHIKKMPKVRQRIDIMTIPLCKEHHQGKYSPHGAESNGFYAGYPVFDQMQDAVNNYMRYLSEK